MISTNVGQGAGYFTVTGIFPFIMIAVLSGFLHRTLNAKITSIFTSYARPSFIISAYLLLFAGIIVSSATGSIGIIAKIITAFAAWFVGAVSVRAFGNVFKSIVLAQIKAEDFGLTMTEKIRHHFQNHSDPFLRGDLETVAKIKFPIEEYPELYVQVPEDLIRPVFRNGKTVSGDDQTVMMYGRLSVHTINQFFNSRLRESTKFAEFSLCLSFAFVLTVSALSYNKNSAFVDTQIAAMTSISSPINSVIKDVWTQREKIDALNEQQSYALASQKKMAFSGKLFAVIFASINGLATGVGIFALMLIYSLTYLFAPKSINSGVNQVVNADEALARETSDIALAKKRIETAPLEHMAYVKQVETALADKSPLLDLGTGTGLFAYRGSMLGYSQNQPSAPACRRR